ncbi:hypothetical protein BS47DRAFT_1372043 [Hydnum rufescens UP504]|uniref:RNA exonuclease 4 n=1 Tax=Hydnum rufescens UP504 TaxID=1448309 RepID=A0A9P6B0G6_9AGAM|nr:hypothetical protein BS47DRAFT_1372043 [Hydnum rufescens UP504]
MKDIKGKAIESTPPGSNWLALKLRLPLTKTTRKKPLRKIPSTEPTVTPDPEHTTNAGSPSSTQVRNNTLSDHTLILRDMILGRISQSASDQKDRIGRYVCLDCEMVGVGPPTINERGIPDTESSLARVSIVNFHGVILLDAFVKQKEKVTDYRTAVSGIRPRDLVGKDVMTFEEVQQKVADILKGRVLVGHAVYNDLKALLLKHDSAKTVDTQMVPSIQTRFKTKRPGLRSIIKQEFGIDIQGGEHSSVVDARATMALYRAYKPQIQRSARPLSPKRKHTLVYSTPFSAISRPKLISPILVQRIRKPIVPLRPGNNMKGISSGLLVVRANEKCGKGLIGNVDESTDGNWWNKVGPQTSKMCK